MGVFKKIADYTGATHGVDPTGHDHSESEGWLSTIVNRLQTAINGKAAATHTQAISTITGLQSALDGKADTSHTQAISTITGLQFALDGKLESFILYDRTKRTYVVTEMPVGHLILIEQSGAFAKKKLSEMIVQTEIGLDQIHFHLNSGDLTNDFFLVRRFTWTGGTPILNHHFIEVVGAWD